MNQRGIGRTGCLLWILVVVAGAYFGVEVGTVYMRYWQLKDEMTTQAQFAPSLTDATIQRRLLRKVEELQLPAEARKFKIRRTARPREIRISTSYEEIIEFPFYTRVVRFNPEVRQSL